jgi:hypothetical protein
MGIYQRQTITTPTAPITILDAAHIESEFDTAGGRWVTYCDGHHFLMNHETLQLAHDWAHDPAVWCYGCRIQIAASSE